MMICSEACIGEDDGGEGAKPAQYRLVTKSSLELLSRFPFERDLTGEQDGTRYTRVLMIW